MRTSTALIIAALALLLAGCPKRQTARRLIYVPAPPAASEAGAAQQAGVLVIAPPLAPVRPEPAQKHDEEEEASAPTPAPIPKHRVAQPETPAPAADSTEAAPIAAPQLEPNQTAAQQTELRGQIGRLRDGLRRRISRLHRTRLSNDDQKTLQDAELFLSEAGQAMQDGDLQQSLNLAQKAGLLVSAIENRH